MPEGVCSPALGGQGGEEKAAAHQASLRSHQRINNSPVRALAPGLGAVPDGTNEVTNFGAERPSPDGGTCWSQPWVGCVCRCGPDDCVRPRYSNAAAEGSTEEKEANEIKV